MRVIPDKRLTNPHNVVYNKGAFIDLFSFRRTLPLTDKEGAFSYVGGKK